MAIGVTNRSNVFSTTNATSYATATSYTPTAGNLLLAWVENTKASTPDAPTMSGNGQTWNLLGSALLFTSVATPNKRLALYYAVVASPSAGTVTANFGANTQTGCDIIVDEWSGVDTTGGNQFVQNPTANTDAIQLSGSLTFSALSNPANVATAGYGVNDNTGSITCSQTLIAQGSYATPATGLATGWTTGTTLQFTTGSSGRWAMIGVELKAIVPTSMPPFRRLGYERLTRR